MNREPVCQRRIKNVTTMPMPEASLLEWTEGNHGREKKAKKTTMENLPEMRNRRRKGDEKKNYSLEVFEGSLFSVFFLSLLFVVLLLLLLVLESGMGIIVKATKIAYL